MAHSYRVTGAHAVLGHQPGEQFTADLPPEQEQALIEGGHIEAVRKTAATPPATPQEEASVNG